MMFAARVFAVCSPPDTDDLNGKFHRLASETTLTADRLKSVYGRLDGYPNWDPIHLAELRAFRHDLSPAQEKSQLTGRALDAALADPAMGSSNKEGSRLTFLRSGWASASANTHGGRYSQ
jgi:hypothetical protein